MTIISPQTFFLLSLSKLKGVGPVALKKVAAIPHFDSRTFEELATSIPQIARSLEGGANWNESQDWAHAQTVSAERHHARILSPLDPEYPVLLAQTKDDPFILYVQGALAAPAQRSVAVIGTREPTQRGAVVAQRITTQFGLAGWSIVSGLAIGCDSLAHQAALDCGAHTVAVLAHGLHMIAPSKNKKLSQDILAAGGALVSEYPFGQAVQSQQYVKRDRTQAGMALGVVMIQSDIKGGSLYASRAALEYGRWLAVPYPTERDLENCEPKVQANVVIADAPAYVRADLLRCTTSALSRIMILRNKDDNASLSESDGVRPFESMILRSAQPDEARPLTSTSALDAPSGGDGTIPELLLEAPVETQLFEPAKHNQALEVNPSQSEDVPAMPIEAVGLPARHLLATAPDDEAETDDEVTSALPDEPILDVDGGPTEAPEAPTEPTEVASPGSYEPNVIIASLHDDAVQVVEVKVHPDAQTTKAARRTPLFLLLALGQGSDLGPAFGLWSPPRIGTKEFKERLGNGRDDRGVREFYARHRRLQSHLAKLQRNLVDAKRPLSFDKRLDFQLDGEEAVLHLANLARATANIEALATSVRLRDEAEDWVKRESAERQSADGKVSATSESRRCLVEELSSLLKSDLRSFVIDDGDSDAAQSTAALENRQLALHQLVERLNSVLKAAFWEEFVSNSGLLHRRS